MKKYLLILMILFITAAAAAGCASGNTGEVQEAGSTGDEEMLEFTLINMTDMEIHDMYISVSNMENWGSSLLGKNEVFHRGDEMSVEYPVSDVEMYDIKCQDSDGNAVYFTELALASVNKVTLTADESGRGIAAVEEKDMYADTQQSDESTTVTETTETPSE